MVSGGHAELLALGGKKANKLGVCWVRKKKAFFG